MASSTSISVDVAGLSERLRGAITAAEEPDADAIAADVLAGLSGDELEEAVRRGLALLVTRTARQMKSDALRLAREEAARDEFKREREEEQAEAREALSRAAADHRQRVEDRFFGVWKETATGRKFLGECTAEDLRFSRDRQRGRSDELLTAAARDEKLALALDENDCETVRELGYDRAIQTLA